MANKQRYVIVCGEVFRWEEKEPFVTSGKSVLGALEYDREAETVKCHECGEWRRTITNWHLLLHSLDTKEYKARHGLFRKTALMSPECRSALRMARKLNNGTNRKVCGGNNPGLLAWKASGSKRVNSGAAEGKNLHGVCREQVLAAIRTKVVCGRCPTVLDVGTRFANAATKHFGSWADACMAAGLRPNHGRGRSRLDRSTLLETLRDFYVLNKRVPRSADCKSSSRLCSWETYKRGFGSWGAALEMAGLCSVREHRSNASGVVAA